MKKKLLHPETIPSSLEVQGNCLQFITSGLVNILVSYNFLRVWVFSRAASVAYGGSQARGQIRAVATGLSHSHSSVGSEPRLATPDP